MIDDGVPIDKLLPEEKLMLIACRLFLDRASPDELIDILKDRLDWGVLSQKAQKNRITQIIYQVFKDIDTDLILPGPFKGLAQAYNNILSYNMLFYEELGQILDRFSDEGIDIMVLKGAVLAELFYHNPGLRSFKDIDLMVRIENLGRGEEILKGMGYDTNPKLKDLSEKGLALDDYYRKFHPHLPQLYKTSARGGYIVELHWALTALSLPYQIDAEGVWRRALRARISGREAWIMSKEDMIIHLAVHLARHRFAAGLQDYLDLGLLCSSEVNWIRLMDIVRENKLQKPLYYSLVYTKNLLGAAMPNDIIKGFEPDSFTQLVLRHLVDPLTTIQGRNEVRESAGLIIELFLIDGLKNKLSYLFTRTFPPVEWVSVKYHQPVGHRIYLYYPRRILYLIFGALTLPAKFARKKLE